jgi:hypothetical protein
MEDEMYEEDADLIEQVSDDDAMEDDVQPSNQKPKSNRSRSNRLSDQINLDDEPALQGYQRTDMIGQGAYGGEYNKQSHSRSQH